MTLCLPIQFIDTSSTCSLYRHTEGKLYKYRLSQVLLLDQLQCLPSRRPSAAPATSSSRGKTSAATRTSPPPAAVTPPGRGTGFSVPELCLNIKALLYLTLEIYGLAHLFLSPEGSVVLHLVFAQNQDSPDPVHLAREFVDSQLDNKFIRK